LGPAINKKLKQKFHQACKPENRTIFVCIISVGASMPWRPAPDLGQTK